jgi:hypothetical protein
VKSLGPPNLGEKWCQYFANSNPNLIFAGVIGISSKILQHQDSTNHQRFLEDLRSLPDRQSKLDRGHQKNGSYSSSAQGGPAAPGTGSTGSNRRLWFLHPHPQSTNVQSSDCDEMKTVKPSFLG